jgi:hypothetical protein
MNKTNSHLLVYIASSASLTPERFECERLCAAAGTLTNGMVWQHDKVEYDWSLVREQIEMADAFLFVLGEEYGQISQTGISYQHRELVYARSLQKPIMVLIKNTHEGPSQSEDARRLADFHAILMKEFPFRVWHLGDELSVYVNLTLQGWQRTSVGTWMREANASDVAIPITGKTTPKQSISSFRKSFQPPSREVIGLLLQANVYRNGNLSLQRQTLEVREDQLWQGILPLLRLGISENSLTPKMSTLLLGQHQGAHAVDDVRVERAQFHRILMAWRERGLVECSTDNGQTFWALPPSSD